MGELMKAKMKIFMIMLIVISFSLGCASVSKDTMVKCPKCGTYFSTKEGAAEFESMKGPGATRR
jgi:uncharacterized protein YceK